ncbi:MAG: hypothetical protein RML36_16935 [Anaerolineae bacterium]|nr:hypothetical protein [Anaerolineae bacterium]
MAKEAHLRVGTGILSPFPLLFANAIPFLVALSARSLDRIHPFQNLLCKTRESFQPLVEILEHFLQINAQVAMDQDIAKASQTFDLTIEPLRDYPFLS